MAAFGFVGIETGTFATQQPADEFIAVPTGAEMTPYAPSLVPAAPEIPTAPAPKSIRESRVGHSAPQPAA